MNKFAQLSFLVFFAGCQEAAFYEKEALVDLYRPDEIEVGEGQISGSLDDGSTDGGSTDGGSSDGGSTDGGSTDGGSDGGSTDGGSTDGGSTNGGSTDGGSTDGGSTDGGSTDGGSTDGGSTDGGSTDGGSTDGGSTDGGSTDGGSSGGLNSQVDSFTQTAQGSNKVDILWVVDNSGSMGDNQAAIANNFNSFIDSFLLKDTDFQMYIITTDPRPSKAGKQVPRCDVLLNDEEAKKNESKFKNDFSRMIKVGTNGSGFEQGLNATEKFIDRYKGHPNRYFRDDAYLAVVFVSDEEDQSPEAVDHYVNQLKAEKGNNGLVRGYSIVDTIGENSFYGMTPGFYRYQVAAQTMGGQVADINGDFHTTLQQIGNNIVYLSESFPLSNVPAEGTLEVYVDGVKKTSDWVYDANQNVVHFDEASVPASGAQVEIFYQY